MALNSLGLGLLFTAQDQASGAVTGLTRNVKGLEGQADKTSRTLQTGLGGAAALALGTSLSAFTDQAASFEFGLAKVKSIATATSEDMAVLRDAAFEAGLKTQFSPQQAVEGLQNLAAAGFTAAESAFLLDKSLVLAQAGQISVADATATVATSVKLFNLNAEQQNTLVDKLLKTTNMFKIQASDLEQGIAKTSAAALLTNQSVEEMLLTVGLIKNVFPDAGEAGNSISRAMQNLAQKAGKVKKQFGVDVIDPKTGGFKNALDLFIEIDAASKKRFPKVSDRADKLSKLFGAFGVKGFSAAIGSLDEFATKNKLTREEAAKQLRGSIDGAEGTADRFLNDINSTFQGQKVILEGAIQTLMVAIGEPLNKILKPAMKAAADGVSNMARAIRDMDPALKETVAKIALVASGFLAAGGAVAVARAASIIMLPIIKGMALSLVGVTIAAAPVALVLGMVGAAVMGLRDGMSGANSESGGLANGLKKVMLTIQAIGQVLTTGQLSEGLNKQIDEIEFYGLKNFVTILSDMRGAVLMFFRGVRAEFASAVSTLGPAISNLGSAFMELGRAFGFVAEEGGDARSSLPSSGFFTAGAMAARIMATSMEALARVFAAIIRFSADVVTGIRGVFSTAGPQVEAFGRALGTLTHNLGLAGESMFAGGEGGKSLGESIGTAIGKILVVGLQLATVMVQVTTSIVAGFRSAWTVVGPVLTFLIDNIEYIAILMAGRFATSFAISGVRSLMSFGGSALNAIAHLRSMASVVVSVGASGVQAMVGFAKSLPMLLTRLQLMGSLLWAMKWQLLKAAGAQVLASLKGLAVSLYTITGQLFTMVGAGIRTGLITIGKSLLFMGKMAIRATLGIVRLAFALVAMVAKSILMGLKGIALGIRAISLALMANPIALILASIAAAAALIIIYWEPISAFFSKLWSEIVVDFMSIWNPISGFFTTLWNGIAGIGSMVWGGITSAVTVAAETTRMVWEPIGGFFQTLWDGVVSIFEAAWSIISGIVDKISDAVDSVRDSVQWATGFASGENSALQGHLQRAEAMLIEQQRQNAAQTQSVGVSAITGGLTPAQEVATMQGVVQRYNPTEMINRVVQANAEPGGATTPNGDDGTRTAMQDLLTELRAIKALANRPVQVNVDGRTIATAVAEGSRENAADYYQPVSTGDVM